MSQVANKHMKGVSHHWSSGHCKFKQEATTYPLEMLKLKTGWEILEVVPFWWEYTMALLCPRPLTLWVLHLLIHRFV